MRAFLILSGLLVLGALQMTLLSHVAVAEVKPDLFLLCACYLGLRAGEAKGAISGFSLGLLEDSLSLSPLGVRALSFGLIGFLLGLARRELFVESPLARILLLSGAGVFSGFTTLLALNFFLISRPIGETFWRLIVPESLLTTLAGLAWASLTAKQRRPRKARADGKP